MAGLVHLGKHVLTCTSRHKHLISHQVLYFILLNYLNAYLLHLTDEKLRLREVQQLFKITQLQWLLPWGHTSWLCKLTSCVCKAPLQLHSTHLAQVCGHPKNTGQSEARGPFSPFSSGFRAGLTLPNLSSAGAQAQK